MSGWDCRLRAGALGLMYLGCGILAVLQTRFEGGGFAFIWPSSALLLAFLTNAPRREWPLAIAACAVASVLITGVFGIGWALALPLLAANMIEAIGPALLLRRLQPRGVSADSVSVLVRFVIAAAGLPAIAAGALSGVSLGLIAGVPMMPAAFNWYTGHTLGLLTFTPLFGLLFSGEIGRRAGVASGRQRGEFAFLMALVAGTAALVFSQSTYPMLFLPMLPIILATFRAGRLGAGVALSLLALIAAGFTMMGHGPVSLIDAAVTTRVRFLQFYLAIMVLTVVPIGVELARRKRLTRALKDSEARYRALADHSTDIIMNLDVAGVIRFVSPAIRQLGGYDPEALIGRQSTELLDPDYIEVVRAAHVRALETEGAPQKVEYLGILKNGGRAWFETHTRAVLDENRRVTGVVSVIRDIGERKALEASLADAAVRDSLTGLLNRRGFLREVDAFMTTGRSGCLALFDLDHFKRVNDVHGHAGGDEVLKLFARLAGETLRTSDQIGRLGGEEFAVLLKGASPDEARAVCERLREAVADTACLYERQRIRVTVSGGVAELRGDVGAALRRADIALYAAKEQGRDRLALAA